MSRSNICDRTPRFAFANLPHYFSGDIKLRRQIIN
jgi:hypothetical protein